MALGGIGVPRGLTPEGLVPMHDDSTPNVSTRTTEYEIDNETGAALLTVQVGGPAGESTPFVKALVDVRLYRDISAYTWKAWINSSGIAVTTSIRSWRRSLASIVWEFEHGEVPYRVRYLNGDKLDNRLHNLSLVGETVKTDKANTSIQSSVRRVAVAGRLSSSRDQDRVDTTEHQTLQDAQRRAREIDPSIPLLPAPIKIRAQLRRKGSLPESVRRSVFERDGGICYY